MKITDLPQDEAYRHAAEKYGSAIERLARGYEADRDLASDLVQDIHAALWRSFEYFEGQCSLRSWGWWCGNQAGRMHG